jgi:MOSC domain-containing protein YiiM
MSLVPNARIAAVFTGRPKLLHDHRGDWTSSIFRERVHSPIHASETGLEGDRVTQSYHGGPGAALCVHLADHYTFWNSHYETSLKPGDVGENLTLEGITEDQICVGDVVRLGTALMQISGPRVPCANLARRIGRSDWVKLTIIENRTGFYLRVLEPGTLQEGDAWILKERLNENGSIRATNRCAYLNFDPEYARQIATMAGLDDWWKEQMREKLDRTADHWTDTMTTEVPSA